LKIPGGIIPFRWAASSRNDGRHHSGGRHHPLWWAASIGSARDIAQETGFGRRSIRKWLKFSAPLERRTTAPKPCSPSYFLKYLSRRWAEGRVRGRELLQEIKLRGYTGSFSHLERLLAKWRGTARGAKAAALPAAPTLTTAPTSATASRAVDPATGWLISPIVAASLCDQTISICPSFVNRAVTTKGKRFVKTLKRHLFGNSTTRIQRGAKTPLMIARRFCPPRRSRQRRGAYGDARWRRLTEERGGATKGVFRFDVQGAVAKSTHAGIPARFIRQRLGPTPLPRPKMPLLAIENWPARNSARTKAVCINAKEVLFVPFRHHGSLFSMQTKT
jgi:hypothetical protein